MSRMLVFDSREWRKAGGDHPDGNARFWHEAEILKRYPHREGLGESTACGPSRNAALGTTRTTGDED